MSVRARIHVTSAEGAAAYLPVNVTIAPKTATLVSNPGTLQSAMVRGERTLVDFDIANVGGAASGPIQLQLPDAPWLSAVSDTNIPSLSPGQTNRVTLSLTPDTNLALQEYDGSVYFAAANTSLNVPFKFRAISDGVGDLHLQIKDEYTFYVAGAPLVSNALVQISDPIDGSTIANIVATNGDITIPNIREGSYQLTVSADQHSSYQSPVNIQAGTTGEAAAFLSRQTVTYHWSVVPTVIEDHYNVVLESVFETEVPIPVVTIDNPMLMPLVIDGEDTEMDIQISNHGLIAAQTIQVSVPTDDPDYIYIPLTTNLDTIPAMSTIKIPVIIHARDGAAHRTPKKKTFTGCETLPKIEVRWSVTCGEDHIWHANEAQVVLVPVDHDCGDEIKDYFKDQINKLKENGGNWKDLLNWKDKLCELAGLIAGCLNDECLVSIVNMACGIATEDISTAVNGALHFGNCICPSIPNITIPLPSIPQFGLPPPPPIGTVTIGIGGGAGGGGPGSGPGNPIPVPIFWDYQGCTPGTTISGTHIKREVVFGKKFQPKAPTTSAGSVCAQVRIRIDQKAAIARSAFLGTLEIDNGDPTYNLTGVGVTLDIRDNNGKSANDQFAIKGPSLSGLTAVDGTGVVLSGANGSAQYTFIPTHSAAPTGPAQYKIGGTLQYYEGTTNLVQVPLIPADITVFPDPVLHLIYFQQRDVYGPDPQNLQLNLPSEPFDLGLMVTNSGYGPALNFAITSGQPKIIDNQKGLLIDFKIVGTEVGSNAITPSLTANLGQIEPKGVAVCDWELLSSLQGRFIEYQAKYEHVDSLGNSQISLIDSVDIHELIHKVLADRPGDDNVPDFLVNDVPDPDNLPDTVYLSDGSIEPVSFISGASTDGSVGPGHLQVHLTAPMTSGWNYLQLPDPGPGFRLNRVVRSDAKEMLVTNNVWTTDRSFPSSITGAIRENLLHLFDYNGTGSYTLSYRSTNTTPPMFVKLDQVTPFVQTGAVSSLNVTFSEPIDLTTFDYRSLTLTRNGGANLITSGSGVTVTLVSNATYAISGLQTLTASDGNYQLTINGSNIQDLWGNSAGNVSVSTAWSKGNVPPVVQSITPVSPNPRNVPVTTVDVTFSKAINPATFDYHALTLTFNGGANLADNAIAVTALSSNSFRISGLGPLTGVEGYYVLTVDATAVQDAGNTAGFGLQSVTWKMITTPPHIVALEQLATNPRNIVVQSLNVTFSEPVDATTFDYHDITLTLNGGPNLITGAVTVSPVDSTTWQIRNFNWAVGYPGTYTITVNAAGISDLGGNAGIGSVSESWQMITTAPASPTNLVISPDLGLSASDGLTSINSLTLTGTVGTTNLTVRIFDDTTGSDLGTASVIETNFSAGLTFSAPGQHHLRVTATDVAANVSPATFFDVFLDFVAPSATAQQVTSPHHSPVTNITVTFSKPILTNTIAATNFALVFNDTNSITPTLSFVSSNQFVLGGISSFTASLGVYQLRINQNGITDRAGNVNTTVATMTWTNGTTNVQPFLAIITNQTVAPEIPLYFETAASDDNGDTLTFSLNPGAPVGARINPANGAFFWKPARMQASSMNAITVRVTDNGNPPMSTTQSFTVIVLDYLEVSVGFTNLLAGQSGSLPVSVASSDGLTNLQFTIDWPSNRLHSATFTAIAPQIGSSSLQDYGTNIVIELQATPGQVLQGSQQIGWLNFSSDPSQSTAYIPLPLINMAAAKTNGVAYSNYVAQQGAVIVVQDQAYVLPGLGMNIGRLLTVYGKVGAIYQLQYSTNAFPPNTWYPTFNFTQTNGIMSVSVDSTNPFIIYRLLQP